MFADAGNGWLYGALWYHLLVPVS